MLYVTCPINTCLMGQVNKINKNSKIYKILGYSLIASCLFIHFVVKTFSDRFHQRHNGFSSIGYLLTNQKLFNFFYPCLVLSIKIFRQFFPAFGQLKLPATSPNDQVGKKVNVKPCYRFSVSF